jgi:hypothetical protein
LSYTWQSQYRPSKRPSVKQVKFWELIYDNNTTDHWRGAKYGGRVEVYNGYPFPDFYKVIFTPAEGKKVNKLFYGESAHHDVTRFVSDLGFQSVYYSDLI